jgi:hypothetical protein
METVTTQKRASLNVMDLIPEKWSTQNVSFEAYESGLITDSS